MGLARSAALIAALLLLTGTAARADVIQVADDASGWYGEGLVNGTAATGNAYLGTLHGNEFRDWFAFNLSSVTNPIVSATFNVDPGGWLALATTANVALHEITTDPTTLGLAYDPTVFNELATGTTLGSYLFHESDTGSVTSITLDATAIADRNAARLAATPYALGVQETNLSFLSAYEAIMYQNPNAYTLTLTTQATPEPSTLFLAGMGLLGVGLAALRKKSEKA
ncbi:MAG TPA: PEP-CTERM sorting domain-containing protein [Pirellulales bacterium]|nr:PEP-CTERM sorting domain-containing protein [Pirellulales bacterium]